MESTTSLSTTEWAHSKEGIYEKLDFFGDDANIPRASWEMNDINQINLE